MANPIEPDFDDDISPSDKDPAEGAPDDAPRGPAPRTPSHLGSAGDPAEGSR
jgi:hypothetical protein